MFKELAKNRLPTGRAWQNPFNQLYIDSIAEYLEGLKSDIERSASLRNSFADNYEQWQKGYNLTDTDDRDLRYANVVNALSTTGAQSRKYIEEQLNNLGFDVSVSANYNPTLDPSSFVSLYTGIVLARDDAFLNSPTAQLNGGNSGASSEFIVNYIDPIKDAQYADKHLITTLPDRWKYVFFIHEKNGNRTDPANIPANKRELFRRTVLQIKNFGTWGVAFVKYQ